jgi:putative addiction module component (TIGR02574 family)
MPLQYVHDNNGDTTAVLIPIDEWHELTDKHGYPQELSQAQKDFIDRRLEHLEENPNDVISLDEFLKEIDNDD